MFDPKSLFSMRGVKRMANGVFAMECDIKHASKQTKRVHRSSRVEDTRTKNLVTGGPCIVITNFVIYSTSCLACQSDVLILNARAGEMRLLLENLPRG